MNLVLDKWSSLAFWRFVYPTDRAPGQATTVPAQCECAFAREDVLKLKPAWLTEAILTCIGGRIDALAFDYDQRRSSCDHVVRGLLHQPKENSFYLGNDGVYIASPGFIFLLMASELSFVQLLALGYELCGYYSFNPLCERGIRKRKVPLTTVAQLDSFVQRASGSRGCAKARKALAFMADGSASPMETECYLLISLPFRYGGYGMDFFSLNFPIPLNETAARIADRDVCYGDICCRDLMIDIEYQGKYDHANRIDYDDDRARINGIKEMGYEVIELTSGQVGNLQVFEDILLRVAKKAKRRIDKRYLGATPERISLRNTLFDWNAAGGYLSHFR